MKALKLLSTALCAVPILSTSAHSEKLKLSCLYQNCSPAVLVPYDQQAYQKGQIHSACRSVDAHIRAIEYLLIKRYEDPTTAPDAALSIYQRYPEMIIALRKNEYIGLTNIAHLPLGGYPLGYGNIKRLTPFEHVALVEDGYKAICEGLNID